MARHENIPDSLLSFLRDILESKGTEIDFKVFSSVSERFVKEYKQLQRHGMPGQTIAIAMLCATMNMFSLLGNEQDLPQILRELADLLDKERPTH